MDSIFSANSTAPCHSCGKIVVKWFVVLNIYFFGIKIFFHFYLDMLLIMNSNDIMELVPFVKLLI